MDRGDIYFVDLEPTTGRELRSRRPVIIVTLRAFNQQGVQLIAPITNGGAFARNRGFAVNLVGSKTTGFILCNQLRTIDIAARNGRLVESAPKAVVDDMLARIGALLPEGAVLITGAVRPPETVPSGAITRAYNSVYVLGPGGAILSVYDKVHLVPFGEYLPLQEFLERLGLLALTKVPGGFIAGDRRRLLSVPRAPDAVPLVCYEVIFPGEAEPAGKGCCRHDRRQADHGSRTGGNRQRSSDALAQRGVSDQEAGARGLPVAEPDGAGGEGQGVVG